MTWIRKDDQMPIHRKIAPLSDAAYRLMDEAMCWSSRNLTDGRIRKDDLPEISKRGKPKLAAELVARELWHQADAPCSSPKCPPAGPDGWVIHDYLDYNPSKDKVRRERDAKAERQRRWIEAKRGSTRDASREASEDASRDGPLTHAPRDGNPAPPRPAPKEGGSGDAPTATAARRAAAGAGGGGRNNTVTHPSPNSMPKCPHHAGQPAHNCGLCRADQLATPSTQEQP